jgi:hypothetical protein
MIKSHYFPEKNYSTKEELFKDLKDNLDFIIDAKKSMIQKTCDKGISVTCKSLDLLKFQDQNKAIKIDDNFYYIAVNSTKILDSHDDLHLDGIWKKSIEEQQGKNYLVIDHELEVDKVVVRKEHIEMLVAKVPFSLLGKSYEGETQALIYKVPKAQVKHEMVREWLESGDEIEASVRMQYVTFVFCMDSNNPEDATEKANYDQYFPMIANKSDFDYIPYFFAIKEAKNVRESSLVVFGSNATTGQIKINQAEKSLEEIEAEKSLHIEAEKQTEQLKKLLNKFN